MKKKLCALKKHLCKTCAQNLCRNVHTQKCAEIVHTKMCRKCAHTKCAELCTRRFVQKCAHRVLCRSCAQSLCPSCAQSLCPRIVSTKSFRWCTTKSFMRVNIVRHVCRKFCAEFCADLCKLYMSRIVRRLSHVQNVKMAQKWPKMTKIDNLAKMAQNGPKWPKMAENVPGGYMTGHRPPAISYTGWQKLPEYALIRIAAGPKVADLPLCAHVQKSPISAPRPDGKSRRFAHVQKSPLFGVHMCAKSPLFRSTPQNICASCVRTRRHSAHKTFCGTKVFRRAAHHSVMSLCPWRKCAVFGCAHILQMCTHSAHMCWKYPSGLRAHGARVHSRAHPCTNVHSRNTPCTSAHPCVHLRIMGECMAPDICAHNIYINCIHLWIFFLSVLYFVLWLLALRYAKSRTTEGGRMRKSHKGPNRNFVGLDECSEKDS